MSADVVVDLRSLASQIRDEHDQAELAFRAGVERAFTHAIRAGRMLAEAKAQLEHGEWAGWLAEHIPFSQRRAQEYMQLAASPIGAETRASAHLTIDGALREIRQRKEPKETPASPQPAAPEPSTRPADVASALRDALGNLNPNGSPQPPAPTMASTLDDTPAPADTTTTWTSSQDRQRRKLIDMIDSVRASLSDIAGPRRSPYSIALTLRETERQARQATAMLAELAFTFEQ